jgi:hypothetical protein
MVCVRLLLAAWVACTPALLAACSGTEKPAVEPNLFPADYKDQILKAMPEVVADTAYIRDAGITDPALMQFGAAQRYAACVRFNPRKSGTEYDGIQVRLAIFNGGSLTQFTKATTEQCGSAAYKPFPEMERLCLGERCRRR